MITGIAHVCFTTSSIDATLDFYCGKLGLIEAFPFLREDGSKMGVYLHVGGRTFLEFFEGTLPEGAQTPPYRHLCLEVDDIEAAVRTLREKGLEVTDVKMGGDNSWQAWLEDPDGNRIELHQYTEESKQTPSLK
ncbi:MAG TPA: VOC family protein [Planctomycetota bacterium]|nr:VOC family protein [Planctomycetota bacterium]